ncbi:MAG: WYL domain-containing protein [Gammaproteobacteria bacterium]|nr:WYL domain-containing protein [Gammaproteobacteria bacterium]
MDRFDRIFELNRIFRTARYPVPRQQLEVQLECSRATVKRLIEEMRLYLNAPIVYDRKLKGYRYENQAGEMYELPGLWFNASELQALLSVQQLFRQVQPGLLDTHLQPLRRRIDQLLSQRHVGTDELPRRIRILQAAARPPGRHFVVLAGAVAARRRVQIRYFSRVGDSSSDRQVSPQRMTHYRDNWYLEAWCHLREALRTFSLDAIREARPLEERAIDVPEDELEHHYTPAYGIFSGDPDKTAVVRFSRERARWVSQEQWHPEQQSRWLADGRYELSIPYHHAGELVMDLLRYGPDVEVLAPDSLREEIVRRLTEALQTYHEA